MASRASARLGCCRWQEVGGVLGRFFVVDGLGGVSQALTPSEANNEASKMLVDARRRLAKLSIVWLGPEGDEGARIEAKISGGLPSNPVAENRR